MHCRDITESEYEAISAELTGTTLQADGIETVTGRHEEYGFTVLVRDAFRCMALLEDAGLFDMSRPAADLPKAGSLAARATYPPSASSGARPRSSA